MFAANMFAANPSRLSPARIRGWGWYCYRATQSRRSHLTYTHRKSSYRPKDNIFWEKNPKKRKPSSAMPPACKMRFFNRRSKNAKPCLFALNQNEISFFAPQQTLFLSVKIAIFCRIVPSKISQNVCTTVNVVSFFENRHFLSHRPPIK